MNRVADAIARQENEIKSRLESGKITQEMIDKAHADMNMELDEFVSFQGLKSAMMGTILTTEEAQTIYGYLGEVPATFNAQPLAVKITLTKMYSELLERQIVMARGR